ncbi:CU044_5270 family protein [Actinomadura barringtoniae]|uniref:CU044_5270 family protein n=1 Tax=Actinomadura barringtoniae TaxID=1427535 RepID=A0A939T9T6_9ACTN|nr:CU044_5270 family protein [Actinomadura barringtoniae]MBO2454629.1 CU044_5270 family protein [Actinomadura barringtoniae]
MDEMRMVRDAYAEPAPPTAQEIARAKALLNDPPRRPVRRQWWGFGGVVVVGAAAAVAISLTGGGTSGTPGGPASTTSLDAKGAVLAAAYNAERQPLGKYWYSNSLDGQAYIMRATTGTYAITGATAESFSWFGVKKGMGEAYFARDLPAHPQTARDTELWRKAGSPTSFHVWSNDHYYTYPGKVSPKWRSSGPEVGSDPRGGGKFLVGLTTEELQKLPTDPAALAAKFLDMSGDGKDPMSKAMGIRGGKAAPAALARMRIARVGGLLNGAPMPPKVRAGLMRALADQPGIYAIGRDTDALGRTGVALASDDRASTVTGEWGGPKAERGTYRSRSVIIFDQRTGGVLAQQEELTTPGGPYSEMKPGFIINYVAARSSNWTDTKPGPPAELPFR